MGIIRLQDALKTILIDHGDDILNNPRKAKAYLSDYTGDESRNELKILLQLLENNVHLDILNSREFDAQTQLLFTRQIIQKYFQNNYNLANSTIDILFTVFYDCGFIKRKISKNTNANVIDQKMVVWKKKLLDLGKRNRLINYHDTKRSSLRFTNPAFDEIWNKAVVKGRALEFAYIDDDEDTSKAAAAPKISPNTVTTNQPLKEQQKTLRNLKSKSKSIMEEQGVNILYLAFGFINWTEKPDSEDIFSSPILLVPAFLSQKSITSPFLLTIDEDDIVINPTLAYKMEHDFGLIFPDFDPDNDIQQFFNEIEKKISALKNWSISQSVVLSLFSFLKINMYNDIESNDAKIKNHPIVKALCGDTTQLADPMSINPVEYDHDKKHPQTIFQVLDADSSQQDAIVSAQKGLSFVLQGPPGTGKSQTIANIIGECLAAHKKVLFVSEKVAALDVVAKRLKNAGIGDFCLPLHSHKSNKKDIIALLGKNLSFTATGKSQTKNLSQVFSRLSSNRIQLNKYSEELHVKRSGLQKSVYEMYGELAHVANYKDIVFPVGDIDKLINNEFDNMIMSLEDYSVSLQDNTIEHESNPWVSSTIKTLTYDLQHEIEEKLNTTFTLLSEIIPLWADIEEKLSINSATLSETLKILKECSRAVQIPCFWLNAAALKNIPNRIDNAEKYFSTLSVKLEELDRSLVLIKKRDPNFDTPGVMNITKPDEFNEKFIHYKSLLKIHAIWQIWGDSLFSSPLKIRESFSELAVRANEYRALLLHEEKPEGGHGTARLPYSWLNEETLRQMPKLIDDAEVYFFRLKFCLKELDKSLEPVRKKHDNLESLDILGIKTPDEFDVQFNYFKNFIRSDDAYSIWEHNYIETAAFFAQLAIKVNNYNDISNKLFAEYRKEIIEIDSVSLLKNFQLDYSSFFRYFKKQFYEDRKLVIGNAKEITRETKKKTIEDIICDLKLVCELKELKDWFNKTKTENEKKFGKYYNGVDTDIEKLRLKIECFKEIIASVKLFLSLHESFRQYDKLNSEFLSLFSFYYNGISTDWNVVKNALSWADHLYLLKKSVPVTDDFVKRVCEDTALLNLLYDNADHFRDILESIGIFIDIYQMFSQFEILSNELSDLFSFYHNGFLTDWKNLRNALSWAENLYSLKESIQVSEIFIKRVCEDKSVPSLCLRYYTELSQKYAGTIELMKWFNQLFDKKPFTKFDLPAIYERIARCKENINSLNSWIDYRNAKEKCLSAGLELYITKIESEKIQKNDIVPIFKKQFYKTWIDHAINESDILQNFRIMNHERSISDFKELDKRQFTIARDRICEMLTGNMSSQNTLASGYKEIRILQKELNKKRRIMPLRKLFQNIPNLLLTLKPCLMMSPLSVSLFLESGIFNFDTVIFDEASQVCTENAIGAISKGKQVILAGDSKQLPPTTFFTAAISESEYEEEDKDDYTEIDSFESILDEADSSLFPTRTLKWHYRSRHEHLIAFSNLKIYDNKLITFPSNIVEGKDNGVEYIHVQNGVYDKGGRRDNVEEAKKVVVIIFEHLKKHPERSLGVITFSGAQRETIENVLRRERIKNPSFDEFFNEDKEEPFFIKNIETVQGDERDTIIFSIGYGKDPTGKMSMFFGPLSATGGERRLNVAITRAKYNVKLVGSILPADIKEQRITSEGPKLLRSYIDFAITGPKALTNNIIVNDNDQTESPFEKSVYDFLVQKGYKVSTQIGCSGYRIDMGIHHPDDYSTYCLGIECDGATYHSSRTARERDRLRQDILEDMGWKIYRIWSTDWIRNTEKEKSRLLEFVGNVLNLLT